MRTYLVFGLRLRSDLELVEAMSAPSGEFDCELIVRPDAAPAEPARKAGEEVVFNDVWVRSYELPEGHRLVFDDTGTFDISGNGRRIIWWSEGRSPDHAVETDVLGRVLAFALHGQGTLTLHASAVRVDGQGIAFLGPKFFGKSTLAASLVRSGGGLIGDDTLAIDVEGTPRIRPGIQSLRLWREAAETMSLTLEDADGSKSRFRPPPQWSVGSIATPLAALYVLAPARTLPGNQAVVRERCSMRDAVLTSIRFRKLGALLDGQTGASSFDRAAQLARSVPTFRLRVLRDLARLDEVTERIMRWHRSPEVVPAAADPAEADG